jgi:hypothetical protein
MTLQTPTTKQGSVAIIIVAIIVFMTLAVGGFIVYNGRKYQTGEMQTAQPVLTGAPTDKIETGASPTASAGVSGKTEVQADTSGSTDTQLDTQMQAQDTELKNLDSDSTNIDSGLNDKQGDLSTM